MYDRLSPPDRAKLVSAYHALSFIENDMLVGLGTGSTAAWLVRLIEAERHLNGLSIRTVPTSSRTRDLAALLKIPLLDLDTAGWLDLTIDGADEFDPELRLIKGGGGALLQEKIVARASDRMVVITDSSKEVAQLGAFALPVEVVRFGADVTQNIIEDLLQEQDVAKTETRWRMSGAERFVTDEGHFILDLHLQAIGDAEALAAGLLAVPGVVETGLFLGLADTVILGAASGEARIISRQGTRVDDIADAGRFDALIERMMSQEGMA